ncbi:M56 family metallopeptidase [Sphingopyxis sp. OPL5]|uniref:M56 family metallopeptidase n=1 Tax=Sphingopyxis sp. OPL5 TaxID=2486273 RepID=UPI00164D2EF5|nr:M56 family metallopeptidase [Sphingopyxis sp. OPL5]QNO28730.1 M56 family metallopeptidase [Sphingopyxis sp. OPL5]
MMLDANMLLGFAWKSAAIAGVTLLLLRLARSRSSSERSMIAHSGLFALLALPAAILLMPQWAPLPAAWFADAAPVALAAGDLSTTGGPVADLAAPAATSVPVAAGATGSPPVVLPSLGDIAPFLYAVPLVLLFGVMLLAVVRLFAMRGRAEVLVQPSWLSALAEAQRRMGFKHGTALLVSEELRSPISWGVLRPTIVLSPKAVAATGEAEAIIAHELAHVARLDWAKLLGARVACAVFWFSPFVWMLARESHQLREEAADDAVLMADIDGPDYATLLVGAARHDNKATLIAAHGVAPAKSSLKRRITRVLDGSLKRGPASGGWMFGSLMLLVGLTVPLAAFSATAPEARQAAEESRAVAVASRETARASARTAVAAQAVAEKEAEAAAAGKPLTPEQLIGMRAVGVTPEDVRQMQDERWSVDADDVIAAKASGVDAAYIGQMRRLFPGSDVGDMIGAASVGVDAAYAREIQSYFPGVGLDDLTGMRAMGVDGAYIREMRKAGVVLRTPDDAIALRAVSAPRRPFVAKGPKGGKGDKGDKAATVRVGPGGVIEARSADGRVARIEIPEAPQPPEPPED